MPATIEQIAQKLGLSRATVSRVLNGSGRISEKTRQRVLDMARQLGYKPNKAARALVKNRVYHIAIIIFSQPLFFWNQVRRGIDFAYEELRHFRLDVKVYVTDINKPEEQVELLESLSGQFDAIALAPNNPMIMGEAINRVVARGIPVVTFNNDVPESNRICYVGSDYIQCGMLAGEIMGKMLGGEGDVAVFTVSPGIRTIEQRVEGFCRALREHHAVNIVEFCKFSRLGENAYERTCEFLDSHQGVSGLFVSFGILNEVANAVAARGRSGKVRLIGYDLNNEIREHIMNGTIDAVIAHEPFVQGYFPVKILYKLLADNTPPFSAIITTKAEAVFKSNLDCHMNEEVRFMEIS